MYTRDEMLPGNMFGFDLPEKSDIRRHRFSLGQAFRNGQRAGHFETIKQMYDWRTNWCLVLNLRTCKSQA